MCFDSVINRACGDYAIVEFDMEGIHCAVYGAQGGFGTWLQ